MSRQQDVGDMRPALDELTLTLRLQLREQDVARLKTRSHYKLKGWSSTTPTR